MDDTLALFGRGYRGVPGVPGVVPGGTGGLLTKLYYDLVFGRGCHIAVLVLAFQDSTL